MANDFVQLPADSVGKRLRTFRVGADHVEAVRDAPTAPVLVTLTSANLAAGASVSLDTPVAVGTGNVGKLAGVLVAAGVPLKAEIITVLVSTPITRAVVFTSDGRLSESWEPPHRDWVTVGAGGTFRVRLTNQDNVDAADVYATIAYDEDLA